MYLSMLVYILTTYGLLQCSANLLLLKALTVSCDTRPDNVNKTLNQAQSTCHLYLKIITMIYIHHHVLPRLCSFGNTSATHIIGYDTIKQQSPVVLHLQLT